MNYCVCDTRNNNYLVRQNCGHTRHGFSLEYIFGSWKQAMRLTSVEANAVAVAMWPLGTTMPTPYAVEEIQEAKTA
jgi:hypothetical protein